jgi:hypothetical protein
VLCHLQHPNLQKPLWIAVSPPIRLMRSTLWVRVRATAIANYFALRLDSFEWLVAVSATASCCRPVDDE